MSAVERDAWPRTARLTPWALALFVVVIWTLPVQGMYLPAFSPIETKPDRVALALIFGCAFLAWLGRTERARQSTAKIPPAIAWTAAAYGLVILAGITANSFRIARDGDFTAVIRSSMQFVFYGMLLYAAFHAPRPREASRLIRVMVVLALVAALGTLVEYATDVNVFYELASKLALGGYVDAPPGDLAGGRRSSVGPSSHGLEITTMLAMMLPFLVAIRAHLPRPTDRMWTAVAAILVIAGGVATLRRTALILPVIALGMLLLLHRPSRRQIALFIPFGAILGPIVAPGALSESIRQLAGKSAEGASSASARADDYTALMPSFEHYFLLGRGQGAFTVYERILDNNFLGVLVQTGALGLLVYLVLLALLFREALRIRRDPRPQISALGSALAAAIGAFTVSNALFDTLAFVHVPYVLLLLVGLVHVAASGPSADRSPEASTDAPVPTALPTAPGRT